MSNDNTNEEELKNIPSPWLESWKEKKKKPDKKYLVIFPERLRKVIFIALFLIVLLGPFLTIVILSKINKDKSEEELYKILKNLYNLCPVAYYDGKFTFFYYLNIFRRSNFSDGFLNNFI